jgi:hypothetical protein
MTVFYYTDTKIMEAYDGLWTKIYHTVAVLFHIFLENLRTFRKRICRCVGLRDTSLNGSKVPPTLQICVAAMVELFIYLFI